MTSTSLEDALTELLDFGPMTAAEFRAEFFDLMERVEAHHGCQWMASIGTSPEVIYAEAEDWAEQESGVALEAPTSDLCLTFEVQAIGDLGFSQPDDEERVVFTLIFEDYDDDWMKSVEVADTFSELDLSLDEAWTQLGDRPILGFFWEG